MIEACRPAGMESEIDLELGSLASRVWILGNVIRYDRNVKMG